MYLQEVQSIVSTTPIRNTWDAARLLQQQFADTDREYFVSVNLDAQGRPISCHVAGIGSICAVHFAVDGVFKVALLQNASSVMLCHNHPGGTPRSSIEDLEATKLLVDAGKMLGIKVLDHFIITPTDYLSLREERDDLFN